MIRVPHDVKKSFLSVIAFLLVLGTVACSSTPESSQGNSSGQSGNAPQPAATPAPGNAGDDNTPKPGGILKLARAQDLSNLDPIVPGDNMTIWTLLLMYDQLVRVSADGNGIEPALATDWKISDDHKTYTFNLRKDVKFHDGSVMTPADVKFSLDRARAEGSNWSWIYTGIESVEVSGENQVTIKTKTPYAPLLSSLALFSSSIVSEKVVKEKGKDFLSDKEMGTGPFRLANWQRGQKVELEKNPDYWQTGKPYLDGVELVQVPEDTTRLFQLRAGDIDIASNVPFNTMEELKADPALTVMAPQVSRVDVININHTHEPFGDGKIRQAINYAVDKELIIKTVLMGNGEPATSYLPKMKFFNDQLEGYKFNLEKAKQLMAESSKPQGFKTKLLISSGDETDRQIAVIVKDQLAALGIDVEIQMMEPGAAYEAVNSMNYDLATTYFSTDIIDPDELTSFEVVSTGGTDAYHTGYKNPKVDELAEKARAELDEAKRKEMYMEIQKLVSEDATFLFLYYKPASYAVQNYVKGFNVLSTGNYRLEDVWLNK
ncbi:ABC transporter substrate-binding protein [Brevibacillus choshinensis]|uniref:ABC transporter substrate-binding protein n=1 Tax=Brevibacillus choshinensis TaxID=54911 RepID=UPI002E1EACDE|nr:ABC transporter substrate-binding protein [Brevibacillus choshinensis]MED4751955.1 ABC transporter substrate-binding protein [Brevibacillus choshinensis]MED4784297.1 ABC transporter substrate-binding protein [Brevibacillus choshinensis]